MHLTTSFLEFEEQLDNRHIDPTLVFTNEFEIFLKSCRVAFFKMPEDP